MDSFQLKRPTGIYIVATLFVLAPFGNLLINYLHLLPRDSASGFFHFLSSVSLIDWFVLALTFVSGLLLFRQHKTSWSLAIVTLVIVLSMNLYRWNNRENLAPMNWSQMQLVASCLTTSVFLVLAFYFRFPYLDRRDQWFLPSAKRYAIRIPAHVIANQSLAATTESISITGLRLNLHQDFPSLSEHQIVDLVLPNLADIILKVQIIEQEGRSLRLKFKSLSATDRRRIAEFLKSQQT